MKSYDYPHRKSVEEISWERFAELAASLAERLAKDDVKIVVGVARAGLFPATAIACALRRELYPVRLTRRVDDKITFDHPVWRVDVSADVHGKPVAIVDEMADSGETLAIVAARTLECGAKRVVTASLVCHSWAKPKPDHAALVTDAFVVFPWDRRVLVDGNWQPNPEIVEGLRLQGKEI